MDFANERYVRLYVRETTTFRLLSWKGQALMPQILRLVDRAGVLELAGENPIDALILALPKWPADVIGEGLTDLIQRKVVELVDDAIVWPRFVEAQETAASSAERNKKWRETKRLNGETKSPASETKRTLSIQTEEPEETVFARCWIKYPKRAGGNPRGPAFEAWRARVREGTSPDDLESAVERYAAFCSATGKTGTEYVMQGAAFFGPKKRGFEETWEIPSTPAAKANGSLGKYNPC